MIHLSGDPSIYLYMERTTIGIDPDMWNFLNRHRKRGMTFNDVLYELLDPESEEEEEDDE